MPAILSRLAPPLLLILLALTGCRSTVDLSSDPVAPIESASAALTGPPRHWAAYEGRRVRISAPLTVSGNHRLPRSGELVASFDGRLLAPTEVAEPGAAALALGKDNDRRRIVLALDADQMRDATPGAPPAWRSGTRLQGVEGIVNVAQDRPVLRVDRPLRATPASRPAVPEVAGDVRLVGLNLENLFNGDGHGAGFPAPRGARTYDAYLHQRAKLVATLRALDADIVALMELENDGEEPESSLAQLVAALNAEGGDWRWVSRCAQPCARADTGLGDQPIRVALIYRAGRLSPVGLPESLAEGPFRARSRVPLAQTFRAGSGPAFTVVAVHLKSKGCSEVEYEDRDQHDGQACWNATRLASARRLDVWLRADPTRSGSDHVVILGDFNSYAMEDPMRWLRGRGWIDALDGIEHPYTYIHDAAAGRLDHALLSPTLAGRLAGAAPWHINADEADNVGDHAVIVAESTTTPWRSADHDPILVGMRLRTP